MAGIIKLTGTSDNLFLTMHENDVGTRHNTYIWIVVIVKECANRN